MRFFPSLCRGFLCAVLLSAAVVGRSMDTPLADARAVVVCGAARFTVLTDRLLRMEWAADGKFEDRASLVFVNRRLPVPHFTQKCQGDLFTLDTDALHLRYRIADDGRFNAQNLSIALSVAGQPVSWKFGMSDAANLLGTTRTLDGALGDKTREPIEPGLVSRTGWAVVDDSTRPLFDSADFSFALKDRSPWPWVMERPAGQHQDLYFFGYGHDYRAALADYVRVAGRIPLPPPFVFGVWWSRYWSYSDQELDDVVEGFRSNGLPLDVLVVDMDWHRSREQLESQQWHDQSGHELGWSGYSWNRSLFPYPQEFLASLHSAGLHVTLNLHPASGVEPWEDAYPRMAQAMGIDPATQHYVPFDLTSKKFARQYFNLLHHPLEKQGVDFWWLDWQQELSTQLPGLNTTWWLNYAHFTDQQRQGVRPLLFHRWGGLGNHRYQIGFSGDTISAWESLAFQPWFTATAANVGYAYWSHDIGGHMPGVVSPELYTRWLQFGLYSPVLRTHTTKNPDAERRVWNYSEPWSSAMRRTLRQREALVPYLYTEARHTYDSGVAMLHPLYYDWPESDDAYTHPAQYAFGSQMIVAPVTHAADTATGLAVQNLWIPPGEWIETSSGRHLQGPHNLTRHFALDEVPVYVRPGAIIPSQPAMLHLGQKPIDPLGITLYPLNDQQRGSYSVYADAGHDENYRAADFTWTPIHARQNHDLLTVHIDPVQGHYPGMIRRRSYELRLPADWPPEQVLVCGHPLSLLPRSSELPGWQYDGATLTTIIRTPRFSVSQPVEIQVRRRAGALAARAQLDGFAGVIRRLGTAYATMNALWPFAAPGDALTDAWQTGDRLRYHPETAAEQLARLPALLQQAIDHLQQQLNAAQGSDEELVARLMRDRGQDTTVERARSYRHQLQLAWAQLLSARDESMPAHVGGAQ